MRAATAPATRFAVAASLVFGACALLVRSQLFAANADVAAWGVTFDLTITVPLLYWFFVVRPGKATMLTLAPVFVLSTLAASVVIPRADQQFLRDLARFAVPLAEVLLIGAIGLRLRRARGRNAIRELLGDTRAADVVESELLMLRYAFLGWRDKPEEVEGRAITFHERSGWPTILACIFVLLAAEGLGMHLLLARWSATAAWTWTALDLWAAVWLIGDYHALRTRRSSLTSDALHIRFGLRWSVTIPLALIERVVPVQSEKQWKRKDVLKIAILEEPTWLVELREPVIARGLAGIRKEILGLALLPDQDLERGGPPTALQTILSRSSSAPAAGRPASW